MNNYENPYIRLQTYYSWISRGSYDLDGMSILELHHYTQIPIDTIRLDIAAILKWQAAINSKYDGDISFYPGESGKQDLPGFRKYQGSV